MNGNVALVVLDTLRKDSFDEHFDWLPGERYENAWSTSHWTVPSHASLFAGKYGSELGVHGKSKRFDCSERSIGELLTEAGWGTHAFSANTHVSQWFDFDRGFENFECTDFGDDLGFNWAEFIFEHRHGGPERYLKLLREAMKSDAPLLSVLAQGAKIKLEDLGLLDDGYADSGAQEALRFVESTSWDSQGEFLFLNLMEAHAPYHAPEAYQTVDPVTVDGPKATISGDPGTDPSHLKQAYDDCVTYLSDVYAEIFEELESNFDVIITLSDHGEAFGEYGGWEHFSGLWPAVTHIPLVISTPESQSLAPDSSTASVSLLDVFQTICDYADIDSPQGTRGDSLFDHSKRCQLVETHGMLTKAKDRLKQQGIDVDTLEKYDVPLHAVVEDGYSFEKFDKEIVDWHGGVEDAEGKISDLVEDLDIREVNDEATVPDHVADRLNDLGYA